MDLLAELTSSYIGDLCTQEVIETMVVCLVPRCNQYKFHLKRSQIHSKLHTIAMKALLAYPFAASQGAAVGVWYTASHVAHSVPSVGGAWTGMECGW